MGNVYLKTCAFILSVSILMPSGGALATGTAPAASGGAAQCKTYSGSLNFNPGPSANECQQIVDQASACAKVYGEKFPFAKQQETQAQSFQGATAVNAGATLQNNTGGNNTQATNNNAAAAGTISQADAPAKLCEGAAGEAEQAAKTYEALMRLANGQAKCNVKTEGGPDIGQASSLKATCVKHQADNKGIMAGLSKAALPLAALAAGALGGYLLGKSSGGDDEGDDDGETETTEPTGVEPAPTTPEACAANSTMDASGVCVVDSPDDTCYAADGTTEDKTKVRDSKGVCVSKSSLCETGYDYDTVNKVCKKSTCASGYSENEAGECVDNGTGGKTIAVGTPDPIIGEDPAKTEDEETLAEKLAKNKAKTSGSGSTSSSGGSARNAAAAPSSGKGSGSFQASGGGTGGGGAGSSFAGGGFAANGGGADGAGGKDTEVQYQPVKWANPKKDRPLRNVLRK
jgi:hypothetical protein